MTAAAEEKEEEEEEDTLPALPALPPRCVWKFGRLWRGK